MAARRLLPLFAISVLALAATCGDGDTQPPRDSGIRGYVTIGPQCPVVQEDSPCPDAPYAATIVIEDEDGDEVAGVTSGEDGRFEVGLDPGTYTLVPQQPNAGGPPQASEEQVEVVAGEYTDVLIQYDSGIR
jgi:hypothetical protein